MVKSPEQRRSESLMLAKRIVLVAVLALSAAACTPTIRVEVAPINIYAKLDADVRVKLDKEVQTAIQQNPDLF
jgi:hypothetical protein